MIENTCCFSGHRQLPEHRTEHIRECLYTETEALIGEGVDTFICGGAVGFDMLSAITVLQLKEQYGHIRIILALPCRGQDKYYNFRDIQAYSYILKNADEVFYISDNYSKSCMHERNRYMVDNSAYMIAYCLLSNGGTAYTIKYAEEKGIRIINII